MCHYIMRHSIHDVTVKKNSLYAHFSVTQHKDQNKDKIYNIMYEYKHYNIYIKHPYYTFEYIILEYNKINPIFCILTKFA